MALSDVPTTATKVISPASLLVVGFVALALVPAAQAAPPTLLKVDHVERHPRATWTLIPGSEAQVIEVATSPQTGSDGYFFEENREEFDTLQAGQTTWLSSSQLKPGTFYVHVASYTPSCLPCPVREWSETLSLVVRNQRPSISRLRKIRYTGRYVIEAFATFRYCDDTNGFANGYILERHWLPNLFSRTARHSDFFSVRRGCSTRTASWYPSERLFGIGWHSVRLQVRDEDGGMSNKLTRKLFVGD